MATKYRPYIEFPSGVDDIVLTPEGVELVRWATSKTKYIFSIYAKDRMFCVWRRRVRRSIAPGWPVRPEWAALGEYSECWRAIEHCLAAKANCVWGWTTRDFRVQLLHPAMKNYVDNNGDENLWRDWTGWSESKK